MLELIWAVARLKRAIPAIAMAVGSFMIDRGGQAPGGWMGYWGSSVVNHLDIVFLYTALNKYGRVFLFSRGDGGSGD